MPKLVFQIQADYDKVIKLRNEIAKLKQELKGMDSTQSPAAFKTLNTQLAASTQQLDGLVSKAAQAGAEMENGFKKKIFDASQSVNGFTEKIIAQKAVVRDVESDVRKLAEAYQNAGKGTPKANAIFADYKSAKKALEEEKVSLFALQQEQANARLSVKKLRDEYSLFKKSSGDVVDSNKELISAIQGIPGPIGQAASSIKSLTKASLAFIATPLGAVLALISAGLATLFSWFKRTEEGQNALNVASAYFKQTLDSILDVVDDVGEWIWKAFSKPKEALTDLVDFLGGQVMNRLKAFGKMGEAIWKIFSGDFKEGFKDFGNASMQGLTGVEDAGKKASAFMNETNQKAKERMEIAKKQNELDAKERANLVERSKLEAKINELREKAYDERISEKERAKAIKEASALTKKMYDDEIALAQERYEIIRDTNALSNSNKDAKMKEAQAEAEVNRLQAAQSAAQRDLLRQSNRFNNHNKANILRENQEKYNLLLEKQALEQKRSAEDLQMKVDEARIKAMDEGSKKTIAQMELNFEKEMQAIDRQKEDALRKKIEDARAAWDANPKNKGKSFDATGIKLSDDDKKYFDELYKAAITNNEKAYSELTNQYLSYTDQRIEIEKKFNNDIAILQEARKRAEAKGNTDVVAKIDRSISKRTEIKNENVFKLDAEQFKKDMNWEQVFGNLDKVSTDTLKRLKVNLKDFISTQKDLSPENLKELVDAIERIDEKISERNPFDAMLTSFKALKSATNEEREAQEAYNKALKEGTDEEKKNAKATLESAKNNKKKARTEATMALHDGVDEVGRYVEAGNQVLGIMETLGVKTPEWLNKYMGGVGEMLNGLSSIDLEKPMSIVTGSLQTIKGALTSVISLGGLIPGLGGADYSRYNKMKEEYDSLINVWDTLISKKQQYIDISYGDEARKVGQEALDLLDKKVQSNVVLGIERLNSGASIGSHSIGVRQRKGMSKQGWDELRKAAQSIGFDYSSVADGRMTGLFDLTAEQLSKLQDEAPTFWAKLDSDVQSYLQNIIDCNTELEDMKDKLNETMTGVSFDSFYDSFVSTLADMDKSSKDMADDFGEYLKSAILSNLVANKYRTKIEALYNDWANKSDSDGDGIFDLTAEESAQLKAAQQALAEEMIAERDAMADAFGWTGNASSQSATNGGFQTMSQDTGSELNGRFTALQIAGEEIKNQSEAQSQSLNLLTAKADAILSVNTEVRNIADDTRDLIANSYLELVQISENTGAIVKPIQQMQKDIAEVKKNTEKL